MQQIKNIKELEHYVQIGVVHNFDEDCDEAKTFLTVSHMKYGEIGIVVTDNEGNYIYSWGLGIYISKLKDKELDGAVETILELLPIEISGTTDAHGLKTLALSFDDEYNKFLRTVEVLRANKLEDVAENIEYMADSEKIQESLLEYESGVFFLWDKSTGEVSIRTNSICDNEFGDTARAVTLGGSKYRNRVIAILVNMMDKKEYYVDSERFNVHSF